MNTGFSQCWFTKFTSASFVGKVTSFNELPFGVSFTGRPVSGLTITNAAEILDWLLIIYLNVVDVFADGSGCSMAFVVLA